MNLPYPDLDVFLCQPPARWNDKKTLVQRQKVAGLRNMRDRGAILASLVIYSSGVDPVK